eukprot:CAMPEP_0184855010 /NCGR_PEP_ID=MMETSP0580-20130426/361_1 /TAXON_ID=1118495 /ORGANISM="Dactyliosolen fragilissimus" /LENGTH=244 /DNA_ID=CAMNT_0027349417 /DNA_START=56 /DNA_END=790 /DNA_ORIENTATION=-
MKVKLSILCFLASIATSRSFAPSSPLINQRASYHAFPNLQMSTEAVNVIITGNNLEVTEALDEYVNKKIDKVIGKLNGEVQGCDVHLSVNKNPKVKSSDKVEIVTSVRGTVIRCSEETPDMYASIDAVTDRLARKLRKYKERRLDGYHGGPNMGKNLAAVLEALSEEDSVADSETGGDDFVDPEAPVVTKIKSYDLSTPISVQEAVFALDYVDHDFYVFREEESNEISVVYKRNAGGFGLIQPQ